MSMDPLRKYGPPGPIRQAIDIEWALANALWADMRSRAQHIDNIRGQYEKWLNDWRKDYGFAEFSACWRYLRLGLDLQSRLLIEQILWDWGKPWSNLDTGFRPVSLR